MKTLFDFNPTPEEINRIFPSGMTKEEYLNMANDDTALLGIATLHYYRKNYWRMKWYAMKVKDVNRRNSFFRTVTHP